MPDELTPTTNIEKFLAKTAGESVELPEPATRIEKYLNKIASEQTITEATDTWLDEHIDPSTGYVLDSTLTMNNAAPPASAVGDLKSATKHKYFLKGTYILANKKATAMSEDATFKSGKTYVIILYSSGYEKGRKLEFGVSNTNFSLFTEFVEHYAVVKYRPESDVTTHFWGYSTIGSSKTFAMWCEEWDLYDEALITPPDTIIVSASNSVWTDKYISKYICNWENDNITIQQAINDLPPTGGEVILCDGNYIIDSLTDTEDEEVGLIAFEITNPTIKHFVSIRGKSKPIRDSAHEIKLGAAFFFKTSVYNDLDSSQHVTIFGARPTDSQYMREPRALNFSIKNIGINLPGNQKSIKCIDGEYFSALEVENVAIGISSAGTVNTSPNANCIGIRGLGGWNYGIYYTIKCVKILGMGVAFDLGGEHLVMEQCAVRYSDIPYRFYKYGDVSKMAHPQTLINCCEEHCNKSLVFGANTNHPQVTLIDYNIEYRPTEHSGSWARTQKAIEETVGDINGEISFTINKENYTNIADTDFWESGSGINFITRNSVDKKYGTTANRPTNPNLMQQYYDTTLSKLILFDGTNWVDANEAANPFIVTLTPTAQDFSGTMDKTVAEINAAYEAGRKIVFRIYSSATEYVEVDCTMRGRIITAGDYPSFNGYVLDENLNLLIYAYTGVNASASSNTYSTKIFQLTLMS